MAKQQSAEFSIDAKAKSRDINAAWMESIREIHKDAHSSDHQLLSQLLSSNLDKLNKDYHSDELFQCVPRVTRRSRGKQDPKSIRAEIFEPAPWEAVVQALQTHTKYFDWKKAVKGYGPPWHLMPFEQNGAHTIKEDKATELATARFSAPRSLNQTIRIAVSKCGAISSCAEFLQNCHRMSAPDELHSLTKSSGLALQKYKESGDDKHLVAWLPILFSIGTEFAKGDNETQRWIMGSTVRDEILDDAELVATTALDRILDVGGLKQNHSVSVSDAQLAQTYKQHMVKTSGKEEVSANLIGLAALCANKLVVDPEVLDLSVRAQNLYKGKNPLDSVTKLAEYARSLEPKFNLKLSLDFYDAKLVPLEAFSLRSLQGKQEGMAGKSFIHKLEFQEQVAVAFLE